MTRYEGFHQWKFTACQYNIENSNGFNTYSMSEGLSHEDKEDLIRFAGSYTPPDELPYRPMQEEIDMLFPIVFSSFPLRSGKWAVTRSVYIGKDYAGVRWGNFFSHAIVSPTSAWPFRPIRLWNSPLFADGLTEQEQQEHTPIPLPMLTIAEADLYDFSSMIPRFLAEESVREQALFPMIESVRDFQASGRTVLLRDEPENIVTWIAAIQYAFPLRLASGITFTTYMHSLSNSQRFHLTGTSLEGNNIPIKSPSLNATCRIFDFPEEHIADPPEQKSRIYFHCIRTDEAEYPGGDLLEMQPFIDRLECKLSDNSLEKCVLLYKYLYQPWHNLPTANDFETILNFFSAQTLPVRQSLMKEQILRRDTVYTAEMLEKLLPHLLTVANESDDRSEIAPMFYDFLVKQFERDISLPDKEDFSITIDAVTNNGIPNDSIERFHLIEQMMARMSNEMKKNFFEYVYSRLIASPNCKRLLFLYQSLLLCLYADKEDAYCGYFKLFFDIRFEEREFDRFINDVIDPLIEKAACPAVFGQIVKLHLANVPRGKNKYDFIDDFSYVPRLQHCGLHQWREGMPAQRQGVAFIRYVLGIPKEAEEWKAWEYHSNIMVYLLKIPFSDSAAKKNALETIRKQMADENMPLSKEEIRHLKIDLLHYTTPFQRFVEMIRGFWDEHRKLSIFLLATGILILVVVILLLFKFT